jgi:hypothetical protein
LRRLLAVEARTAHDRFGLTHSWMVRVVSTISKQWGNGVVGQFPFPQGGEYD